jgi:hypothetical protein
MNKTRFAMAGLAWATIAVVCLGVTQVNAANLKCKPNVEVINGKGAAIKVLSFRYTTSNGAENTEGLANDKLSAKVTQGTKKTDRHTWKNQTLGDVAEHNPITSTRIEYRDDTSGTGNGPWGTPHFSDPFPQAGDCLNSHTYSHTIE